jgi:hypothetical protein
MMQRRLPKLGESWRRAAFVGVWLDFAVLYLSAVVWNDPVLTALGLTAMVVLGAVALLV